MSYLIKNATIVNEGEQITGHVFVEKDIISSVKFSLSTDDENNYTVIDAKGKDLLPGIIDDQVHFREPGLTQKADIYTESKASVAGGITSFMEMPNTKPQTLTQELLEQKYQRASETSLANYSFYMGASNDNLNELLKTDTSKICGIKVFMGASTGNMLVDNEDTLREIFKNAPGLIATHCEDEATIKANMDNISELCSKPYKPSCHPVIRSNEACYKSSSKAVALAKKYNTRLHLLHISTARELELFINSKPTDEKQITAEGCVHHLWFDDTHYHTHGNFIKWNPAIKTVQDKKALREALHSDKLDVIATDHAPHEESRKQKPFPAAPSGGPMVQHSLVAMLELVNNNVFTIEKIVEKMCHNPAKIFGIRDRGFIRKGYKADLVLVDSNSPWQVNKSNILYKCGWSPMQEEKFSSRITHTFVNGNLVYNTGEFDEQIRGERLTFER